MDKKSFLLYLDYEEQFSLLTDEQAGQLIKIIFQYERTGEIPELNGVLKMAFSFIKNQLDRDSDKWKEKKKKRSEAGKKGMLLRWQNKKQEEDNINNNVIEDENTDMSTIIKDNNESICNKNNNVTNVITKDNNVINDITKNNNVINAITKITDNVTVDVTDDVNVTVDVTVDDVEEINKEEMNKVISVYEENIAPATPMSVEILEDYCNDLSPELVKVAIKKAVEVNKRNIKYIKGILNDWLKKGIKNIIDVKNEEEAFRKSKGKVALEETEKEKIKRRTRELEEYINANT